MTRQRVLVLGGSGMLGLKLVQVFRRMESDCEVHTTVRVSPT